MQTRIQSLCCGILLLLCSSCSLMLQKSSDPDWRPKDGKPECTSSFKLVGLDTGLALVTGALSFFIPFPDTALGKVGLLAYSFIPAGHTASALVGLMNTSSCKDSLETYDRHLASGAKNADAEQGSAVGSAVPPAARPAQAANPLPVTPAPPPAPPVPSETQPVGPKTPPPVVAPAAPPAAPATAPARGQAKALCKAASEHQASILVPNNRKLRKELTQTNVKACLAEVWSMERIACIVAAAKAPDFAKCYSMPSAKGEQYNLESACSKATAHQGTLLSPNDANLAKQFGKSYLQLCLKDKWPKTKTDCIQKAASADAASKCSK